jgi:hypothetical protein
VLLWADQPLTYAEFVWGLARVAGLLPPPPAPAATAPRRTTQQQAAASRTAAPPRSAVRRGSVVGAAQGPQALVAGVEERGRAGLLVALQRLLDGPDGLLTRLCPAAERRGPADSVGQEVGRGDAEEVVPGANVNVAGSAVVLPEADCAGDDKAAEAPGQI